MTLLSTIIERIAYLALTDMKDTFYSVSVNKDHWPYLTFSRENFKVCVSFRWVWPRMTLLSTIIERIAYLALIDMKDTFYSVCK